VQAHVQAAAGEEEEGEEGDEFPLGGEGVLIELVQAPPEVIAALG
jgi:hypothetical protein